MQDDLLKIITRQNKDEDFTQVILSSEASLEELQGILIPKLFNLLRDDCDLTVTEGLEEQIIFFSNYFLRFANFTLNKEISSIDPVMLNLLIGYDWQVTTGDKKLYY